MIENPQVGTRVKIARVAHPGDPRAQKFIGATGQIRLLRLNRKRAEVQTSAGIRECRLVDLDPAE